MSGIATYTKSIAAKLLEGNKASSFLIQERLHLNNRIFEKYSVRVGGGNNHRYNLSDGIFAEKTIISVQQVALKKSYPDG